MITAFFRTVILYLLIIAGLRLMGKRQIGELEPGDLVLTLIISDLASVPMQDFGIPLVNGAFPIVILLSLSMLVSYFSLKSIRFRTLVCGRPTVIIRDGRILQANMAKTRFTVDELYEQLRTQGYGDLSGVKYAILETSGRVSVLPKAAEQPVTAGQMGLTPQEPGLPVVLINDGRLMEKALRAQGLDRNWLEQRLAEHGVCSPSQVFLLTVDEAGSVCFVAREAV